MLPRAPAVARARMARELVAQSPGGAAGFSILSQRRRGSTHTSTRNLTDLAY